jgi:hypothetical protein
MYNKTTNGNFCQSIRLFYCSYMFRRTHVIITKLFCSLLNYAKMFMQFFWYVLKKFFFIVYSQ